MVRVGESNGILCSQRNKVQLWMWIERPLRAPAQHPGTWKPTRLRRPDQIQRGATYSTGLPTAVIDNPYASTGTVIQAALAPPLLTGGRTGGSIHKEQLCQGPPSPLPPPPPSPPAHYADQPEPPHPAGLGGKRVCMGMSSALAIEGHERCYAANRRLLAFSCCTVQARRPPAGGRVAGPGGRWEGGLRWLGLISIVCRDSRAR